MDALIVDTLPAEAKAGLEALGLRVSEDTSLGSHNLPGAIGDTQILIVGRTRVTRRTIEAAPKLRVIIRAGSGTDTIDLAAASERGVFVSHCPTADASARAELVFGLVLGLDRGLHHPYPQASRAPAHGLRGKTLGLFGYDATARKVQEIAVGLGMRVQVHSDDLTTALAAEARVRRVDSADTLFATSDVVSLHPAAANGGVVATAARIAAMQPGATLVNISRRQLIDMSAAKAALEAGTLRLGLDVYDADDYGDEVPFAADAYPTLLATDRLAGATAEAADAIASTVLGHVEQFLLTDLIPDCVNLGATDSDASTLIIRFRQSEGVLAAVFEAFRDAGVHVLAVHTGTFRGQVASYAHIVVDRTPTPALVAAITRNPHVIRLDYR
ncbi:MAG: hypothetical protein EP329_03000 [Deltaproteobacteria bacterium]|nr:MAG: hypothetical protein EP329_03000 [Deltaproteobacteria bacterium]